MKTFVRKAIAASEIVGGAAVLLLTLLAARHGAVPAWYVATIEGLGALSVAAGAWLWRDETRGWGLSRLLQALQVVQLVTPAFSFGLVVGIHVVFHISASRVGVTPGVAGSFFFALRSNTAWAFGINLFALFALLSLRRRPNLPKSRPAVVR